MTAIAEAPSPLIMKRARIREGSPHPLGACGNGTGVNFALFSAHATKVELCLFDRDGRRELERVDLPEYTDEVWHGYLPEARPGTVYRFRVHGPYEPPAGHRFNPNKLLLDPYAKRLVGDLKWNEAIFGCKLDSADADLSFDERDSAPFVPKCCVIDPAFPGAESAVPRAMGAHDNIRAPGQGIYPAPSRYPARTAGKIQRSRQPVGRFRSEMARRDRC